MPKITKTRLIIEEDLYFETLEERGVNSITIDTIGEISKDFNPENYAYTEYVWKRGDKLIRLSHKFYGNYQSWPAIGFFNRKPIDHLYRPGETIKIPVNVEQILAFIGE